MTTQVITTTTRRQQPRVRRGRRVQRAQQQPQQVVVGRRARRRNRRNNNNRRLAMTVEGEKFLKCAFAPFDFQADPGMGIPDEYNGRVIMKKYGRTGGIQAPTGKDLWFLVAPNPGCAYATSVTSPGFPPGAIDAGTDSEHWNLVSYANPVAANSASAFRIASNVFELECTSSINLTAGSITVWDVDISLGDHQVVNGTPPPDFYYYKVLKGLNSIISSPPSVAKSFHALKGVYTVAYNHQPDWNFTPMLTGANNSEGLKELLASPGGAASRYGIATGPVLVRGWGDHRTKVIKVSVPTDTTLSFIVRTTQCVEYQVGPDSALYDFSTYSPPHDPVALAEYRKLAKELPLAVPACENAGFWNRVLNVLRLGTSMVKVVPGPIGAAASLIERLTNLAF